MSFKFNPFTGTLDIKGSSAPVVNNGVKYDYHLAALSAYDRVASIVYLDQGLRTERIDSVTLSSVLYPNSDVVKNLFWLDVGLMNQRIQKIEWVGAVFGGDSLRKTFSYSLVGIKYVMTGYAYELF